MLLIGGRLAPVVAIAVLSTCDAKPIPTKGSVAPAAMGTPKLEAERAQATNGRARIAELSEQMGRRSSEIRATNHACRQANGKTIGAMLQRVEKAFKAVHGNRKPEERARGARGQKPQWVPDTPWITPGLLSCERDGPLFQRLEDLVRGKPPEGDIEAERAWIASAESELALKWEQDPPPQPDLIVIFEEKCETTVAASYLGGSSIRSYKCRGRVAWVSVSEVRVLGHLEAEGSSSAGPVPKQQTNEEIGRRNEATKAHALGKVGQAMERVMRTWN